jgi:hypothetical protein
VTREFFPNHHVATTPTAISLAKTVTTLLHTGDFSLPSPLDSLFPPSPGLEGDLPLPPPLWVDLPASGGGTASCVLFYRRLPTKR